MNKKLIPLCLLPLLLVGCNNKNNSSNKVEDDYEHVFNAITLKDNNAFTGYRLDLTQIAEVSSEVVYSESRYVYIDRTNNYYEVIQVVSKIAASADSKLTTETKENHIYYDQGSQYVLQEDNSYKQTDGTVSRSTLMFTFKPTKDAFENANVEKNVNVYKFTGDIIPSKANTLFSANNLSNITNATMEVNVFEKNLEDLSYKYTLNGINVNAKITMFYDPYIVVLPVTR